MRIRLATMCMILALVALIGVVALPQTTQAQSMDSTIVCDSTLITLLYVAEHDYGFHSMTDVSTIEKGQYKPLFDAMMASMDGGMMESTPDSMMAGTPDAMMATPDAMMGGDMMQLSPGVVQGENAACTALRAEIEAFLYTSFTGMMK